MSQKQKLLPGQIYVEALQLYTAAAPYPDHTGADGKPYWGWTGMGSHQAGMVSIIWDALEARAKKAGMETLGHNFPCLPPYPIPALKINEVPMFSEQQLREMASEIASRFVAYAFPIIYKGRGAKEMVQESQYKVPCGEMMMRVRIRGDDTYSDPMEQGIQTCKAGSLCPACTEVVRLRNIIIESMPMDEAARARLSAVVRDFTSTVIQTSDPKYVIISGKICNAKSGNPIPDDEPIMIFRAKDKEALPVLEYYRAHHPYNDDHDAAIGKQILRFADFACQKPDRMKTPDT